MGTALDVRRPSSRNHRCTTVCHRVLIVVLAPSGKQGQEQEQGWEQQQVCQDTLVMPWQCWAHRGKEIGHGRSVAVVEWAQE